MTTFEEKYQQIVQSNKNEVLSLLEMMHALGPAFHAFHKLCKDNDVKPLKKKKGQYSGDKRSLSAYNLFTQDIQKDEKLKDKKFNERSKLIGQMWKDLKVKNSEEYKKYQDKAKVLKDTKNAEAKQVEKPVEAPVPVVAPVVVEAPVAPAPAKKNSKKAVAPAVVPEPVVAPAVVAPVAPAVVAKPIKGAKAKPVVVKPIVVKKGGKGKKKDVSDEEDVDESEDDEDVFKESDCDSDE